MDQAVFWSWLDILNKYSNLVLVIVTGVYVVLTWRMVREMRRAREAELEPYLVASLELFGYRYGKIRVQNVGAGPALDVEIQISVRPENDSLMRIWRHPASWPGHVDDFLLPSASNTGGLPTLDQLENEYAEIIVKATWRNVMGARRSKIYKFDLHRQQEGWFHAGHLHYQTEPAESLEKIDKALAGIGKELREINRCLKTLTTVMRKSANQSEESLPKE